MIAGLEELDLLGFGIVPGVVTGRQCDALAPLFDACKGRAGRRDGLEHEAVLEIACSAPVGELVGSVLGEGYFAIRATLFDKNAGTNWLVPWHQDITIPVRERRERPGFDAWSVKGGVPHARPPVSILNSMLAVRIDLDGSRADNGPLRVIGGSHGMGILTAEGIREIVEREPAVECLVPAGGAVVMRPLLLHSSSRAKAAAARRVLHLEFAATQLPQGLEWNAMREC